MTRHPIRLIGTVVGFSVLLGLVGCDYWPPALQAEIEQLRSETQTLTMEKNQLQAQVMELSRAKQELQGQLDELSRITREKTAIITGLQSQLEAARAKVLKTMTPKSSPHKAPAKSGAKAGPKNTPKPSTSTKPAQKAIGVR
jgi:outer membrane murein-binding lipoprotein Lpp